MCYLLAFLRRITKISHSSLSLWYCFNPKSWFIVVSGKPQKMAIWTIGRRLFFTSILPSAITLSRNLNCSSENPHINPILLQLTFEEILLHNQRLSWKADITSISKMLLIYCSCVNSKILNLPVFVFAFGIFFQSI